MTDSSAALPPPPQKNSHSSTRKSKPASLWPLVICLVLAIGLTVGGGLFFWQSLIQLKQDVKTTKQENGQLKQQLNQVYKNTQVELLALRKANASQAELLETLDKLALFNAKELTRLHASNRVDWLLAEAEYLIRLANQRLNIENDIVGAENILIASDKVLAEADDPSLFPVRKALANEILALQSVQRFDQEGAYLKLQSIIETLDKIETSHFLASSLESETPTETKVSDQSERLSSLWQRIWTDLSKAVLIRRLDEPVKPLLAPEQSYYLKQNLQLMLEQAGLAMLKQDQASYDNSLRKAKNWVHQYFTFTSAKTTAISQSLEELSRLNITIEKPDITESSKLLKARIEAMYRQHQLLEINPETNPFMPKHETQQKMDSQRTETSNTEPYTPDSNETEKRPGDNHNSASQNNDNQNKDNQSNDNQSNSHQSNDNQPAPASSPQMDSSKQPQADQTDSDEESTGIITT